MPGKGADKAALAKFHSAHHASVVGRFSGIRGLEILSIPTDVAVERLVAEYQRSGLVEFAEPDYLGHTATTPNDPRYVDGTLWGLNTIDAPHGWDVQASASNILVAVLDTGVRYTHDDLASNMWVNPNDGSHGLNVLAGTTDPNDDAGHGTMVAGVLGAVGNNGKGVVGVAWKVQIMACKCFNSSGVGAISDVVTCLDYAQTNGARLINASWGFNPDSQALSNAVLSVRDAGIIVVAASGNSATNIDLNPSWPASYHFDNIVSVAYTTRSDTLAAPSNFGPTSVHLAAPGEQIYSTIGFTGAPSDSLYAQNSGTSFSAPYVTGALALMLAKFDTESYQMIIGRLFTATDALPSLAGKCTTGGRLNLRNALDPPIRLKAVSSGGGPFQLHVSAAPNFACTVQISTDFAGWTPIFTNTTSTNGTFDFTDYGSTNQVRRFYRAVSAP